MTMRRTTQGDRSDGSPGARTRIVEAVPEVVGHANAEVARRSAVVGGRIALAVRAARAALVGEELGMHGSTHAQRLRHAVLFTTLGAVVAFFLDPQSGARRRLAAMRVTGGAARAAGTGIGKATVTWRVEDVAPDPVVA